MCSHSLFPIVVTSLEQVTRLITETDVLQVVPTRLIQPVRTTLLQAYCHQLVNNLIRVPNIRLVGTTCCESVGLIILSQDKMITTCSRLVNNWKQAVRTHLVDKRRDFTFVSTTRHIIRGTTYIVRKLRVENLVEDYFVLLIAT